MKFEELKTQVTDFATKMQNIRADHVAKEKKIREVYSQKAIPVYLQKESERYEKEIQNVRLEAINKLNDSVKALESSQGGMTDRIDTALLNELNTVANAGVALTVTEIRSLGEKVLSSGSAICARKLTEIATESEVDLRMPDPQKAKDVIYRASAEILDFYKGYDGNNRFDANAPIGQSRYQLMSDRRFLEQYERQFETYTSSNLSEVKEAVDKAKSSDALQEATQQLQAMIKADALPEKKPSIGTQYANKFNQIHNPEGFKPNPGMPAPDPNVKSKRVPRPAKRPDISLDTSVSNTAEYAKKYNKANFERALSNIDNSADIDGKTPVTF